MHDQRCSAQFLSLLYVKESSYLLALPCLQMPKSWSNCWCCLFVCFLLEVDDILRNHFYTVHLLIHSIVNNPEASASFKALLKHLYGLLFYHTVEIHLTVFQHESGIHIHSSTPLVL
jgi:hypothetical protein